MLNRDMLEAFEQKIWVLWGMQSTSGSPESHGTEPTPPLPALSTLNPSFILAMPCSGMS